MIFYEYFILSFIILSMFLIYKALLIILCFIRRVIYIYI